MRVSPLPFLRGLLAAAALTVGLAPPAPAQSHVSQPKFTLDQWSFTPTYTVSGSTVRIDSVLSVRDPSGVIGDNIVAVWYKRAPTGCTGWTAIAWENCDPWEAVQEVKDQLSLDDSEDAYWGVYSAKPATIATNHGVDYKDGFKSTDPLGTALKDDPNRDWMIEILTAAGYSVADNPLDKAPPEGCKAGDWLCNMASCAEKANTAGYTEDWTVDYFGLAASCAAYFAAPIAPTTVGPWGGWGWGAPSSFVLDHSDATTCYYRRALEYTNCRTITYPPGTTPATQTQCVYYYCTEECSTPKVNGACPGNGGACPNTLPFTPNVPSIYPTPVGPSPGLPFVPQDHPNTMPVCAGGTTTWP